MHFDSNFIVSLNSKNGRQRSRGPLILNQKDLLPRQAQQKLPHNRIHLEVAHQEENHPQLISLQYTNHNPEKESHPFVSQNSIGKGQDRKIKSLSKYEPKKLSESQKKRSALGSEPELATIEGLLNRNMQMVKFSMSKERERIMTKQKYKRSEQVRSLLENKKMSSMGKPERRDTEHSNRIIHPSKLDSETNTNNRPEFK